MQALPYGFYEDEGIDVAGVKNNDLSAGAHLYIKNDEPNNLYVSTDAETKTAESDYYSNYLLKYSLNDAELKDLKMLFEGDYIQANFFIQELSYTKIPSVISEFKIDVDTYNGLLTTLNKNTNVSSALYSQKINIFNVFSYEVMDQDCLFHIQLATASSTNKNIGQSKIADINLMASESSRWSFSNNSIFNMRYPSIFTASSNVITDVTNLDIRDYKAKANLT